VIPHSRPWITEEDHAALRDVLAGELLAKGAGVRRFELELAAFLGTREAVACGSGTGALVLALRALGIGSGAEVVCPSYVCHDVLAAIRAVGATPALCDLGTDGWCVTAETVARAMTARTRAIVAVHTFGATADVGAMSALGVPVIEDAAQALGSVARGSRAGTTGAVGIFSFHATKMLTTGEGGAVVARDPAVLAAVRDARDAGLVPSPMSDLSAALGSSQLARFEGFLARRRDIARRYFDELPESVTSPLRRSAEGSGFFRFPLRWPGGSYEEVNASFAARGIAVRRGVDELNHRHVGLPDHLFAQSVDRFDTTVSIPIYPALRDDQVDRIIETSLALLGGRSDGR
jgi:UDP-4-amino-4-deoxy-L-arabinose-oxoglutarate aminotransferase